MTVFWDVAPCSLWELTDVSEVLTASIVTAMTYYTAQHPTKQTPSYSPPREPKTSPIIDSVIWRNTAIIRFQVHTSDTLFVKELQFRFTTLVIFSAALDKDMHSQCGPRL
jgi:hypothetical protein